MINFEDEKVKELMTKGFGWITPSGALVVCSMYDHYKALGPAYSERYKELVDHYEEQMHDTLREEQESLSDDEYYHPSMHRFDPYGDASDSIEEELYAAGYVRIGTCAQYGPAHDRAF